MHWATTENWKSKRQSGWFNSNIWFVDMFIPAIHISSMCYVQKGLVWMWTSYATKTKAAALRRNFIGIFSHIHLVGPKQHNTAVHKLTREEVSSLHRWRLVSTRHSSFLQSNTVPKCKWTTSQSKCNCALYGPGFCWRPGIPEHFRPGKRCRLCADERFFCPSKVSFRRKLLLFTNSNMDRQFAQSSLTELSSFH